MTTTSRETLTRFADNMKVMVATLEILDQSTKGELSGEEAIEKLDLIKKQFYSTEASRYFSEKHFLNQS